MSPDSSTASWIDEREEESAQVLGDEEEGSSQALRSLYDEYRSRKDKKRGLRHAVTLAASLDAHVVPEEEWEQWFKVRKYVFRVCESAWFN